MRLLLASNEDLASLNIRSRLLELGEWSEIGVFQDGPVFRWKDDILVTIPGIHLYADNIDQMVELECNVQVDDVVFLSRHKAASGIATLTVHPIGNYATADYGGREGQLVPSSPRTMTGLLRQLSARVGTLPFKVSFESTHHGPFLNKPTCYIEIGSSENEWGHEGAAKVIAESIMDLQKSYEPVAIGIGGGHYAPRFSELCLAKRIAFGHMIPNYAIEKAGDEAAREMIQKAAIASKTDLAYVHRRSMPRSRATRLIALTEEVGLQVVDSEDLVDR
jgi:D-aminoacyl-tRNA deacylase